MLYKVDIIAYVNIELVLNLIYNIWTKSVDYNENRGYIKK